MSTAKEKSLDDVLYHGFRTLRDLGHGEAGISFPIEAMRKLDLVGEDAEEEELQVRMTMFKDGTAQLDFQTNGRGVSDDED